MNKFNSFEDYSRNLYQNILSYDIKERKLLEEIMKSLKKQAKDKIGHLQSNWEPLADSTIKDKARKGYLFSGDGNPLLRDGSLMDSIEDRVETHKGAIGSDMDIAVYQEMGTHGEHPIPARSFLGSTMH